MPGICASQTHRLLANARQMIAYIRFRAFQSRTVTWATERRGRELQLLSSAVRSLRSSFPNNYAKSGYTSQNFAERSRFSLEVRLRGGERGIRTLDTGVSPYNGLANESFSPRSLSFKHLQS